MTSAEPHIHILDFNDSFTYNIASEIYELDTSLEVIPFERIKLFLSNLDDFGEERHILIYGPGPGHPKEYEELFPLIRMALSRENIFSFGICLGHQILSLLRGLEIQVSNSPRHGQKSKIIMPVWEIFDSRLQGIEIDVQRYNSLAVYGEANSDRNVQEYWYEGELFISSSYRFLTYQFHPESIGTSFRRELFAPLMNFLYNKRDERAN